MIGKGGRARNQYAVISIRVIVHRHSKGWGYQVELSAGHFRLTVTRLWRYYSLQAFPVAPHLRSFSTVLG